MDKIAPLGSVYQAGTLSGNPVAVAAGLCTLKLLQEPELYEKLSKQTANLAAGLEERAKAAGHQFSSDSVGGMFGFYFRDTVPTSFTEVGNSDTEKFNRFFHGMLNEGVYFAPSAYEASFVSIAHDDKTISQTLDAAERVFKTL